MMLRMGGRVWIEKHGWLRNFIVRSEELAWERERLGQVQALCTPSCHKSWKLVINGWGDANGALDRARVQDGGLSSALLDGRCGHRA